MNYFRNIPCRAQSTLLEWTCSEKAQMFGHVLIPRMFPVTWGRYFKTCNPDQNDPDNQIPLSSATDQPDLSRYFKTLLDWIRVILIPADGMSKSVPPPGSQTGNRKWSQHFTEKGEASSTIVSELKYKLSQC